MANYGELVMSSTDSYKLQIITKYLSGKLYKEEAARILQVSQRTVSRYVKKIRDLGPFGIKHGNTGNKINQKHSDELRKQVLELKKKEYFDYNGAHFVDILKAEHGIDIPYQTVWRWLKSTNMVKHPRRKRRKKHTYRPRLPQEGLMLQMDGSHHKFNGKDDWVLVSCIDDATSEIPYAEFFDGETTLSCMKVLKRIIEIKGVPQLIYTDKAGWAGGGKRNEFSHFHRACERLGIKVLYANSPEAKGRIERSFRTIQDRLIPELRTKGIKSMRKANKYLQDVFLKDYWNKEKVVSPTLKESAYTPLDPYIDLKNVLCLEETRNIGSDQTISFDGNRYVLEMDGTNLAGYLAVVRTRLDGLKKVFVMENEVKATKIQDMPIGFDPEKRRQRFTSLNEEIDKDIIHIMDRFTEDPVTGELRFNWKTISSLSNAVRKHKITGKPLRIKKTSKRVA